MFDNTFLITMVIILVGVMAGGYLNGQRKDRGLAAFEGYEVTLERLDDGEARIRMSLYYFGLYKASAHLAQQISFEDYAKIFETVWKDRARASGWSLEIEYGNEGFRASTCVLRFTKPI